MENFFFGDKVESIDEFDPFWLISKSLDEITIFANSHYVTPNPLNRAIDAIREELKKN